MPFQQYERVRLLADRSADEGVAAGSVGTVVEVFADGYIVEFSRPDGTTIAWFGVGDDEVGPVVIDSVLPRRRVG